MGNRNARVIIPYAIVVWLLSIAVFQKHTPTWVQLLFCVGFFGTTFYIVFSLMSDTGWRTLAKSHPQTQSFKGTWQSTPAATVAPVSIEDPSFEQKKLRLTSVLKIGTSSDALYLTTIFSELPIIQLFFPTVQIPWSAFSTARKFEAGGFYKGIQDPGTVVQINYDPNYTGEFIEAQVGGSEPVFLQFPSSVLGENVSRLPLST
jgi:hypothetical protein